MNKIERPENERPAFDGGPGEGRAWRSRFVRGSTAGTVLRLLILSLVVGLFLSIVGLDPIEFWRGIGHAAEAFIRTLGSSFFEIAGNLLRYVAFGAAIVVPVWIVVRLLQGRRR